MTLNDVPMIVVTDPNELIVMKSMKTILEPGHSWSDEDKKCFQPLGKITLKIIEAKKLMDKDLIAKSDPYCIVQCGPTQHQTKMIPNNLNPTWNEEINFDWLGSEFVRIDCWDHNKYTKHDYLGYIDLNICEILMKSSKWEKTHFIGHREVWDNLKGKGIKQGQIHCEITVDAIEKFHVDVPKSRNYVKQVSVNRTNFF